MKDFFNPFGYKSNKISPYTDNNNDGLINFDDINLENVSDDKLMVMESGLYRDLDKFKNIRKRRGNLVKDVTDNTEFDVNSIDPSPTKNKEEVDYLKANLLDAQYADDMVRQITRNINRIKDEFARRSGNIDLIINPNHLNYSSETPPMNTHNPNDPYLAKVEGGYFINNKPKPKKFSYDSSDDSKSLSSLNSNDIKSLSSLNSISDSNTRRSSNSNINNMYYENPMTNSNINNIYDNTNYNDSQSETDSNFSYYTDYRGGGYLFNKSSYR